MSDSTHNLENLTFDNHFSRLPSDFYRRVTPSPLKKPHLVSFSTEAAKLIGLHPTEAQRTEFIDYFNGKTLFADSKPLAMLYSGHQFGQYVPQLGDGRAMLLGEVIHEGQGWELQLKGSGETPYSRSGDGRAVLRSTIREYLCSEAMAGLGIPTTRALCIIGSEEEVCRERIETGAMLLRMAPSHIRFGSFEIFFHRRQFKQLKILADYVIQRYYPDCLHSDNPYLSLLQAVIQRTAKMIAQWQLVGFAHGVMNTDNMSVLGLTLDYGPFGFLDHYEPQYICNHSDYHGRYAFDQQPTIGLWNLNQFAQSLLPLIEQDNNLEKAVEKAKATLQNYQSQYENTFTQGMRDKLGLQNNDIFSEKLTTDILHKLNENHVDYTCFFSTLGTLNTEHKSNDKNIRELFLDPSAFDQWAINYRLSLKQEQRDDAARQKAMQQVNPRYILRNHLAQIAIEKAEQGDFSEIDRLLTLLQRPFTQQQDMESYAERPPAWASKISISCSS